LWTPLAAERRIGNCTIELISPSTYRRIADPLEKLRELGDVRDKGILTEEEFTAQKTKLLNS
jgi:hypothetical protein